MNAAAKALLEDDLANGVARESQKIFKTKQPTQKTTSFNANTIHPFKVDAKETDASKRAKCTVPKQVMPKANGDAQAQRAACTRSINNSDAVILSAFGSSNASTGRFDIQGKCQLANGTIKTIGILGRVENKNLVNNFGMCGSRN